MSYIKEEGRYDVEVKNVTFGESSKKKTPFVNITFEDKETLLKIDSYHYLSENAFPYTDEMLREVFEFDGDYNTLPEQIKGKEANINVQLEADDNGKEWARVKFVNKPGSGGASEIPDQDAFLAQLSQRSATLSGKPLKKKENPF